LDTSDSFFGAISQPKLLTVQFAIVLICASLVRKQKIPMKKVPTQSHVLWVVETEKIGVSFRLKDAISSNRTNVCVSCSEIDAFSSKVCEYKS
jgi:hypothetical protein